MKPTAPNKIKVAFIYGYEPSGHMMAAKAVCDFMPEIIEPYFFNLSGIYPRLGPFVAKTYLEVLHKTPALWSYVYDKVSLFNAAKRIKSTLTPFYASKLQELLLKKGISAAVSTHALSSILLSKKRGKLKNISHFVVLTDFYAHNYWPKEGIELYFAPDNDTGRSLTEKGIDKNKIRISGIPVKKDFLSITSCQQAKRNLGLNPVLPCILITGGTKGLGSIEDIFEKACEHEKLQIIVLCGTNQKLHARLKKKSQNKKRIVITGFSCETARYYMAADIVIGKPGGVTIAETLALRKTLAVFSPLPGQEEKNAEFLKKHKLAWHLKNQRQLAEFLANIEKGKIDNPIKRISFFSKPLAANAIAGEIINNLIIRRT